MHTSDIEKQKNKTDGAKIVGEESDRVLWNPYFLNLNFSYLLITQT